MRKDKSSFLTTPCGVSGKVAIFLLLFLFLTACSQTETIRVEKVEVIKYVDNNRTIIIQDFKYCLDVLDQARLLKQEAIK